jgi:hypothetical protein
MNDAITQIRTNLRELSDAQKVGVKIFIIWIAN